MRSCIIYTIGILYRSVMRNDLARGSADGKGCQAEFKANVYSALCIFRLVDKYTEAELRRSTKGANGYHATAGSDAGPKKKKKI